MATIYVLFTVMMGMETAVSVHSTLSECEFGITSQKQLGLMDTSNMKCVKYTRASSEAAELKKKFVAQSEGDAPTVHKWILNTRTVRAAGIDVDPIGCSTKFANAKSAVSECFSKIALSDAPFRSFKNGDRIGPNYIRAAIGNKPIDKGAPCDVLHSKADVGDIIIGVNDDIDVDVYTCGMSFTLNKVETTIKKF